MQQVIDRLIKEREEVLERVRRGSKEEVGLLLELKQAIGWLEFLLKNDLGDPEKYFLHVMPILMGHGYYDYRIMIDNETDDRAFWEKYQPKGYEDRGLTLTGGDMILKSKT